MKTLANKTERGRVITDNRWHDFVYRDEVPAKVLEDKFDWITEDCSDGFFKYRGIWYNVQEFQFKTRDNELDPLLHGWDGYVGDSYFSGVVIHLSKDGEQFKIGTYIS